jgi:hypothetical protein
VVVEECQNERTSAIRSTKGFMRGMCGTVNRAPAMGKVKIIYHEMAMK